MAKSDAQRRRVRRRGKQVDTGKGYVKQNYYGSVGPFVEYYRDDDNNSGCGEEPQVQYWYGPHKDAPEPKEHLWRDLFDGKE